MSVFHPIFRFHRIYEIQPEWLREYGISVLLLDVDNTLTTHDNPPFLPFSHWFFGSLGLIHMAVSPIIVSGRVVATTA